MRGKPVVVTFLYTTCRDTCPLTADQIRIALDDLGHDVPVVAVSVDPANDTPRRAQAFLLRRSLRGRMRWALGSDAQLQRLWRAYGIQPQTDDAEHTAATVLLDKRGVQRVGFAASVLTPDALAHDIALLEREGARRRVLSRPGGPARPGAQTGGGSVGGRRTIGSPVRLAARRSFFACQPSTAIATSSGATYSRLMAQWPTWAIGAITSWPPRAATGRVR